MGRYETDDEPMVDEAFDEDDPEQALELAEPRRQRRLSHEAGFGSLSEMAVLMERDQILKLLQGGEIGAHRLRRSIYSLLSI